MSFFPVLSKQTHVLIANVENVGENKKKRAIRNIRTDNSFETVAAIGGLNIVVIDGSET